MGLGKDFSQQITAMPSDPYFVGFLPELYLLMIIHHLKIIAWLSHQSGSAHDEGFWYYWVDKSKIRESGCF